VDSTLQFKKELINALIYKTTAGLPISFKAYLRRKKITYS